MEALSKHDIVPPFMKIPKNIKEEEKMKIKAGYFYKLKWDADADSAVFHKGALVLAVKVMSNYPTSVNIITFHKDICRSLAVPAEILEPTTVYMPDLPRVSVSKTEGEAKPCPKPAKHKQKRKPAWNRRERNLIINLEPCRNDELRATLFTSSNCSSALKTVTVKYNPGDDFKLSTACIEAVKKLFAKKEH